mmetsp:Transcript_47431/g.53045  ORF Transcript_47431/g.53045 Transcript_47431/m.53045 type:complete len:108 (+) Transcript_47431:907-1230(+)
MIRRKWKYGRIKVPPHAMCALQEKDQMEVDSFAVPNVKILIIAARSAKNGTGRDTRRNLVLRARTCQQVTHTFTIQRTKPRKERKKGRKAKRNKLSPTEFEELVLSR